MEEQLVKGLGIDDKGRECLEPKARSNFFQNILKLLSQGFLAKLADAASDVKTVFVWLLAAMGLSPALLSLAAPIRESGSLIPQLFISAYVKQQAQRKKAVVLALVLQAFAFGLCILTALLLPASTFCGLVLLGLLALAAFARALSSLSQKDLLAKTVVKASRGRVMGWATSLAGLTALALAAYVAFIPEPEGRQASISPYLILLACAVVLYLLAALVCWQINEDSPPSQQQKASAKQKWLHFINNVRLLKSDACFRQFMLTRTLLISSSLVSPIIVFIAQQQSQADGIGGLAVFLLASGAAQLLGGWLWGRLADYSAKWVLAISGVLTSLVCLSLLFVNGWLFEYLKLEAGAVSNPYYVLLAGFFVQAVVHQGVRLGRKTYVVNMAEGGKRTDYVATSNGLIGLMLLVVGGLSALISALDVQLNLVFFALLAAAGSISAIQMKSV